MLLRHHLPRNATDCPHAHDVLTAQTRYRARDSHLAARTLADLSRDLRGQALSGSTAHQFQSSVDFGFGNDIEEGGLPKLQGQSLFQRPVEYGVASLIFEIGEYNTVFIGQGSALMRTIVDSAGDE